MAAMRATMHNGRGSGSKAYGTKHNDRNFDTQQADNIDADRTHLNEYWHYYEGEEMSFEAAELRFYEEHFSEQLSRINERYRKNGHPENCRSMTDWKQLRRNAPEECILQIGNMETHVDHQTLLACWRDYLGKLNSWSQAHGSPFVFVSWAMHADEAVPHIQARRVWQYRDEDGLLRVGQENALKAAGVDLPQPGKTENRRNNRKMTFDAMARELWLETLQKHGLDIEQIPVPNGKHNRSKEQMIRDKYQDMISGAEAAQKAAEAAQEALRASQEAKQELDAQITVMQESQDAAALAAQEAAQKAAGTVRRTITGQVKLSQEEYNTLVQAAAIQEAQVASERARNAKYQVALENAKAETKAAQNALSKAMTKPLDQAINEARIASLTEENRKLKEENSRLRQALQRLTDFVREKAPSWLRDFMTKANDLLPMKQRHQGLDR